jgi:hypothetical protein
MNKNELKKILKPLIKECIKEVIFEEKGTLSHIISEVANGLVIGTPRSVVTERKQQTANNKVLKPNNSDREQGFAKSNKALREHKKKLLDAIGGEAYGGVNIFEGTTPMSAPSSPQGQGALSGVASSDPGVDISGIFDNKSFAIFNKMMGKK